MKIFSYTLIGWLLVLALQGCGQSTGRQHEPAGPALLAAAEQGDLDRLDTLISNGPKVDVRDSCQWTPLMKAALNGHLEAARRLLEAGARTELGDKGSYSALMLAASNNHADVVRLLLRYGADPNHVETTHGWSALIWAAKRGHIESVNALIENRADIGLTDSDGISALEWARRKQRHQVVDLLSVRS